MAEDHKKTTGHGVIERILEKYDIEYIERKSFSGIHSSTNQ
jgi:hypothetical protein